MLLPSSSLLVLPVLLASAAAAYPMLADDCRENPTECNPGRLRRMAAHPSPAVGGREVRLKPLKARLRRMKPLVKQQEEHQRPENSSLLATTVLRDVDLNAAEGAQLRGRSACNSRRLRKLMEQMMAGSVADAKMQVVRAAEASLGGHFSVICSRGPFAFLTTTSLYCLHKQNGLTCYAFSTDNPDLNVEASPSSTSPAAKPSEEFRSRFLL